MNKYKLSLNNTYNDIVNIIDDIINEFDLEIIDYNNESFIIKYDEFNDELIEYLENNYDIYIRHEFNNNYLNNKVMIIKLKDPIYKPILYNKDLLIEIFDDNIELIDNNYDSNLSSIKNIIHDDIYELFELRNNNINSYDLLILFDDFIHYTLKDNESYYLIKLFEYVIDDLNKFVKYDYDHKFKINIDSTNILLNKHNININDLFYNEIDESLLYYDLEYNIDYELIKLFNIDYDIDIIPYVFYENTYLNNLSNEYNLDIEYDIDIRYDIKHDPIYDYSILLSINELFKLLYIIIDNNNDDYINDLLKFDIKYDIDKLFESFNNSFKFDEFIYNIIENSYEFLYDDFYDSWNYYIFNYNNKFDNIHDLKKYLLNYLSNLNLNKSFKFNDELYDII